MGIFFPPKIKGLKNPIKIPIALGVIGIFLCVTLGFAKEVNSPSLRARSAIERGIGAGENAPTADTVRFMLEDGFLTREEFETIVSDPEFSRRRTDSTPYGDILRLQYFEGKTEKELIGRRISSTTKTRWLGLMAAHPIIARKIRILRACLNLVPKGHDLRKIAAMRYGLADYAAPMSANKIASTLNVTEPYVYSRYKNTMLPYLRELLSGNAVAAREILLDYAAGLRPGKSWTEAEISVVCDQVRIIKDKFPADGWIKLNFPVEEGGILVSSRARPHRKPAQIQKPAQIDEPAPGPSGVPKPTIDHAKIQDLNRQAEALIRTRKFAEAEQVLLQALGLDQNNGYTLGNLAKVGLETKNFQQSVEYADRALEIDPNDHFARRMRALSRINLKQYDGAEADLLQILDKKPDDSIAQTTLDGLKYLRGGATEAGMGSGQAAVGPAQPQHIPGRMHRQEGMAHRNVASSVLRPRAYAEGRRGQNARPIPNEGALILYVTPNWDTKLRVSGAVNPNSLPHIFNVEMAAQQRGQLARAIKEGFKGDIYLVDDEMLGGRRFWYSLESGTLYFTRSAIAEVGTANIAGLLGNIQAAIDRGYAGYIETISVPRQIKPFRIAERKPVKLIEEAPEEIVEADAAAGTIDTEAPDEPETASGQPAESPEPAGPAKLETATARRAVQELKSELQSLNQQAQQGATMRNSCRITQDTETRDEFTVWFDAPDLKPGFTFTPFGSYRGAKHILVMPHPRTFAANNPIQRTGRYKARLSRDEIGERLENENRSVVKLDKRLWRSEAQILTENTNNQREWAADTIRLTQAILGPCSERVESARQQRPGETGAILGYLSESYKNYLSLCHTLYRSKRNIEREVRQGKAPIELVSEEFDTVIAAAAPWPRLQATLRITKAGLTRVDLENWKSSSQYFGLNIAEAARTNSLSFMPQDIPGETLAEIYYDACRFVFLERLNLLQQQLQAADSAEALTDVIVETHRLAALTYSIEWNSVFTGLVKEKAIAYTSAETIETSPAYFIGIMLLDAENRPIDVISGAGSVTPLEDLSAYQNYTGIAQWYRPGCKIVLFVPTLTRFANFEQFAGYVEEWYLLQRMLPGAPEIWIGSVSREGKIAVYRPMAPNDQELWDEVMTLVMQGMPSNQDLAAYLEKEVYDPPSAADEAEAAQKRRVARKSAKMALSIEAVHPIYKVARNLPTFIQQGLARSYTPELAHDIMQFINLYFKKRFTWFRDVKNVSVAALHRQICITTLMCQRYAMEYVTRAFVLDDEWFQEVDIEGLTDPVGVRADNGAAADTAAEPAVDRDALETKATFAIKDLMRNIGRHPDLFPPETLPAVEPFARDWIMQRLTAGKKAPYKDFKTAWDEAQAKAKQAEESARQEAERVRQAQELARRQAQEDAKILAELERLENLSPEQQAAQYLLTDRKFERMRSEADPDTRQALELLNAVFDGRPYKGKEKPRRLAAKLEHAAQGRAGDPREFYQKAAALAQSYPAMLEQQLLSSVLRPQPGTEKITGAAQASEVNLGNHSQLLITAAKAEGTTLEEQIGSLLRGIDNALHSAGLNHTRVVKQTVYVKDASEAEIIKGFLAVFYGDALPATDFIQQPPLNGDHLSIQLLAIGGKDVEVKRCNEYMTLVRTGSMKWAQLGGVVPADGLTDTYEQARDCLLKMKALLESEGFNYENVLRTWLYERDIYGKDPDHKERYDKLNLARRHLYKQGSPGGEAIRFGNGFVLIDLDGNVITTPMIVPPASTGIGTQADSFVMGAVALMPVEGVTVQFLENPKQVSAFAYQPGVQHGLVGDTAPLFSRGIAVVFGEYKIVYVSGTASIVRSKTIHIGDVQKQTRATLENIDLVFQQAGASLKDAVQLTAYVKNPEDYLLVRDEIERRCGHIPCVYVLADVCRENLLVEIEAAGFVTPETKNLRIMDIDDVPDIDAAISSSVLRPRAFGENAAASMPTRPNETIYEVNTRAMLGEEKTFRDITDEDLIRWKATGATIIWFMGAWETSPYSETLNKFWEKEHDEKLPRTSSAYSISRYEIAQNLGGEEEFRDLTRRANALGIKIMLDIVPNHLAADTPLLTQFPEYFLSAAARNLPQGHEEKLEAEKLIQENNPKLKLAPRKDIAPVFQAIHDDVETEADIPSPTPENVFYYGAAPYLSLDPPWTDTVQLNYTDADMRQYMKEAIFKSAELTNGGGLRLDMVFYTFRENIRRSWFRHLSDQEFDALYPKEQEFWAEVIPELRQRYPGIVLVAEMYGSHQHGDQARQMGFDYYYEDYIRYCLIERENPEHGFKGLKRFLEEKVANGKRTNFIKYLENHDVRERIAGKLGKDASLAAAALLYTLPGSTLVYHDQDKGRSWSSPSANVIAGYIEEDDPVVSQFYGTLGKITATDVFRQGSFRLLETSHGNDVIAFEREYNGRTAVVIVNYSPNTLYNVRVKTGNGTMAVDLIPWESRIERQWWDEAQHSGILCPLFSGRRTGDQGIGDLKWLDEFMGLMRQEGADYMVMLPTTQINPNDSSPYLSISRFANNAIAYLPLDELMGEEKLKQRTESFIQSTADALVNENPLPDYFSINFINELREYANNVKGAALHIYDKKTLGASIEQYLRDRLAAAQASDQIDYPMVTAHKECCLRQAFEEVYPDIEKGANAEFNTYVDRNKAWVKGYGVEEYALFHTLFNHYEGKPWWEWNEDYQDLETLRARSIEAINKFKAERQKDIKFYEYLQWLYYKRWQQKIRPLLSRNGQFIIGDMPLYPAPNSADGWAKQKLFNRKKNNGAPSEANTNPEGQNWGSNPYNWDTDFDKAMEYFEATIRYMAQFYDGIRIDHVLGLIQEWLIDEGKSPLTGAFYPSDMNEAAARGEKILRRLCQVAAETNTLLIGEDIGYRDKPIRDMLDRLSLELPNLYLYNPVGWREKHMANRPHVMIVEATHDSPGTFLERLPEINAKAEDRQQVADFLDAHGVQQAASSDGAVEAQVLDTMRKEQFYCLTLQTVMKIRNARINVPGVVQKTNWSWRSPNVETLLLLSSVLRPLATGEGRPLKPAKPVLRNWVREHTPELAGKQVASFCMEALVHQFSAFARDGNYAGGLGIYSADDIDGNDSIGIDSALFIPLYAQRRVQKIIDGQQVIDIVSVDYSDEPLEEVITFQVFHWDKNNTGDKNNRAYDVKVYRVIKEGAPIYMFWCPEVFNLVYPPNEYVNGQQKRDMRFFQETFYASCVKEFFARNGPCPDVYHINEGHVADVLAQMIAIDPDFQNKPVVYVNHTIEEAGLEKFHQLEVDGADIGRISYFLTAGAGWRTQWEQFKHPLSDGSIMIDMSKFAAMNATVVAGVSAEHAVITKNLFQSRYGYAGDVAAVLNGSSDFWVMPELLELERKIEEEGYVATKQDYEYIEKKGKRLAHDLIKARTHGMKNKHGAFITKEGIDLNMDEPTVWLVRRLDKYKSQLPVLKKIIRFICADTTEEVDDPWEPGKKRKGLGMQVAVGGVAAAGTDPEQWIHEFIEWMEDPLLHNRFVFVPGGGSELLYAQAVGGDICINCPLPGREAAGTSDQRSARNRKINLATYSGGPPEYIEDGISGCLVGPYGNNNIFYENAPRDILDKLTMLSGMYYARKSGDTRWDDMCEASYQASKKVTAAAMAQRYAVNAYVPAIKIKMPSQSRLDMEIAAAV